MRPQYLVASTWYLASEARLPGKNTFLGAKGLSRNNPLKIVFIVSVFTGVFSSAQEVRRLDLTGVGESRDSRPISSARYMICGTEDAKSTPRAVRVSVESLTPTDIHPRQQIFVLLKIENYGQVPVVLPVSPDIGVLQAEEGAATYRAILPLGAGTKSRVITMGWLELYGSTLRSETMLSLRPGEWLTVRGYISVRKWYAAEQAADCSSVLQLYEWLPDNPGGLGKQCVRQVPGASITVRFKDLKQSP